MTYYETLGVSRDATSVEIKRAYRRPAMQLHPDTAGEDSDVARRWGEVSEAYATLIDQAKRRKYDLGNEPIDSLTALFQRPDGLRHLDAMLPSAPLAAKPGVTTACVVEVSKEIMQSGGILDVPLLSRSEPIEVPKNATRLRFGRLAGLGEPGKNGGKDGDRLVILVPRA